MTQQLILHLVVNWDVFTINICCLLLNFITNHLFEVSPKIWRPCKIFIDRVAGEIICLIVCVRVRVCVSV